MSPRNHIPSQSTSDSAPASAGWTNLQAYALAALCLLLGVLVGYLFRGSASPVPQATTAAAQPAAAQAAAPDAQADPNAQAALAQTAAPLLDAVNKNPRDYDSLVKLGNVLYDAKQFPNAIQYYERALALHPENPDVRTDLGTAYWYTGDADRAIAAMETSLQYRPGNPQTLFNLGWVRWQGKADPKGAVQAWEQLLKANPDYPQRRQIEQYIAKAKEHAARG